MGGIGKDTRSYAGIIFPGVKFGWLPKREGEKI
jgi:hypothetical protein